MKITVLTGAGISRESGLATFRDSDGLWEGFDVNKVATIDGWHEDPETVLKFYNARRKQAWKAEPNEGHKALAELEKSHDVTIITQNVDNLHERAGSSNVLHLHGSLFEAKSEMNDDEIFQLGDEEIHLGDKAPDGHQLRPNVVWFGEMVPMLEPASRVVAESDALLVIGTSLVVYPAAGLVDFYIGDVPVGVVDPGETTIYNRPNVVYIRESAGTGVKKLIKKLEL